MVQIQRSAKSLVPLNRFYLKGNFFELSQQESPVIFIMCYCNNFSSAKIQRMLTKLKQKNISPTKFDVGYSLREVKKRAIQNKKSLFLQTTIQSHSKTFDALQVPAIDFSKLINPEYPQKNQIIASKSANKQHTQQKNIGPFTKISKKSKEKLKTVSTIDETYQSRHIDISPDERQQKSKSWKKVYGKLQKQDKEISVRAVSSNFQESFRFVLNELMESYFVGVGLKRKINHLRIEIWNYILKKAGIQIGGQKRKLLYSQIQKRIFCLGLNNIFRDAFKFNQVLIMVARYFSYDSKVFFSQMQEILSLQKDFKDQELENIYEQKFKEMGSSQMVRLFLKTLIEYADLQKKLQLICNANEYEIMRFLSSINEGNILSVHKLARFLDESSQSTPRTRKISSQKTRIFLEVVLKKKLTKLQLIKWLKVHQKILH